MPHTYTNLVYHIIFGTKDHLALLDETVHKRLLPYITGIISNTGGRTLRINGVTDHVHILTVVSADTSIAQFVRTIKANSSKWLHESLDHKLFQWQNGYGAFTVSHSQVSVVADYIEGQAEHHKKISFEEEFEAFLERHGVDYDPRYLCR